MDFGYANVQQAAKVLITKAKKGNHAMAFKTGYPVAWDQLPQPLLGRHPEWVDLYHFAWKLAARNIRKSRGRWHMDAAWDPKLNYQWVWDTCFMALYTRYSGGQLPGVQSLDNFYDLQRADGYIAMSYDFDTAKEPWHPNSINPPLFAWVEWEHYRMTGDSSRFARVIPHIERLMEWIDQNQLNEPHRRLRARDNAANYAGGSADTYRLYFYNDCGSAGTDDSPRTPRLPEAGKYFDWIDLSSQMVLSFRMLANMHAALGNRSDAAKWSARAKETGNLINSELWCKRSRFYHDRMLPKNFVSTKTILGFWPILAGICSTDRLDALVGHLQNKNEFNRPTPVPTLSADDCNYEPEGVYWVGGVWAPSNYMITRGLMRAGRGDVAHDIAMRYLGVLARTFAQVKPHTLWESYSPEKDLPGLQPYEGRRVKPHFVGWTGIGPIAMLIENILGLDVNMPKAQVDWTIRLTEEHGIKSLAIGGGRADFLCAARHSVNAPARVTIRSTVPVSVILHRGPEKSRTIKVPESVTVEATL